MSCTFVLIFLVDLDLIYEVPCFSTNAAAYLMSAGELAKVFLLTAGTTISVVLVSHHSLNTGSHAIV
jgi:hypothetical protein